MLHKVKRRNHFQETKVNQLMTSLINFKSFTSVSLKFLSSYVPSKISWKVSSGIQKMLICIRTDVLDIETGAHEMFLTHPAITCSKLAIEVVAQSV